MSAKKGEMAAFISKDRMNEALLLQQDGWQYVKRGRDEYYAKDRCIFKVEELRKGLDRWVRAATGRKMD